jgi:hypothetical protein
MSAVDKGELAALLWLRLVERPGAGDDHAAPAALRKAPDAS